MAKYYFSLLFSIIYIASNGQINKVDLAIEPNWTYHRLEGANSQGLGSGIGIGIKAPVSYSVNRFFEVELRAGFLHYRSYYEPGHENEYYRFVDASFPIYLKPLSQKEFAFYFGLNLEYQIYKKISERDNLFDNKFNYGLSGGVSYRFMNGTKFFIFYTHGLAVLENNFETFNQSGDPNGEGQINRISFSFGVSVKLFSRKPE